MRARLRLAAEDAAEMLTFGRWLIGQCNDPRHAIDRLARRLARLDAPGAASILIGILEALAEDHATEGQADAMLELRRKLA